MLNWSKQEQNEDCAIDRISKLIALHTGGPRAVAIKAHEPDT